MIEKIKFMKGQTVEEKELKPVLAISKIIIIPIILALCFQFAQSQGLAGMLGFLIFAGLGYYDWRHGE